MNALDKSSELTIRPDQYTELRFVHFLSDFFNAGTLEQDIQNPNKVLKNYMQDCKGFSIIIELSQKILWEEFRIKTNHKVRPGIKGSV